VALKTTTDLDWFVIVLVNGKRITVVLAYVGQKPHWLKHLTLFGEAGTVKIACDKSPKLAD